METKKFYPGDLGPNTGSETSVLWSYGMNEPRIFRETFGTPAFKEWMRNPVLSGIPYPPYHGPIDLNTIISDDDHFPYAIEWTPRTGWGAYYALMELLPEGKIAEIFLGAAKGNLGFLPLSDSYAYEIKMSVPPYPVSDSVNSTHDFGRTFRELMDSCRGLDISGPWQSPHVWLRDAHIKNGNLEMCGVDATVCHISGRADTIEEARDAVHNLFNEIEAPNKQGRIIDGADRALRDIAKLQAFGYETPERRGCSAVGANVAGGWP